MEILMNINKHYDYVILVCLKSDTRLKKKHMPLAIVDADPIYFTRFTYSHFSAFNPSKWNDGTDEKMNKCNRI